MSQSSHPTAVVDADHPWLGLEAFTDKTQAYFFGRNDEIRDIFLRVREHPLTVLFGQSGLGKSSLLGAGLIPKLKVEGYPTALVLFNFDDDSPPLLTQLRDALAEICFEGSPPSEDVTLWELFHRKDLRRPEGQARPPVLILDQFEEVFTLGHQEQKRVPEVEALFQELADLIENSPPASLTERFSHNRELSRKFDFSQSPVRIVLTLREDYLSKLEHWKSRLPSLMRNRMALHLLRGPQALEAVVRPGRMEGRDLVSDEVATSIIRFVAKADPATPLDEIDAVPPLLSLVCAELNMARLDATPPGKQITAKLVEAQSKDILQDFYNRSFAEFPDAVREFVEDRMITVGGHRNPVAKEDAVAALTEAGVPNPAAAIDTLIDKRLLSSEARGGIPRLELTHDVLTPLAVRSRDERNEIRAQKEAATKDRAERAKRERRMLRIALATAIVLIIAAVGGMLVGLAGQQRAETQKEKARLQAALAKRNEREAIQKTQEAEAARRDLTEALARNIAAGAKVKVRESLERKRNYVEAFFIREKHSDLQLEEFAEDLLPTDPQPYLPGDFVVDDQPLYPRLGLSRIEPIGQVTLDQPATNLVSWPAGPGLLITSKADEDSLVEAHYLDLDYAGPASMTYPEWKDGLEDWRFRQNLVVNFARSFEVDDEGHRALLTDISGQTRMWDYETGQARALPKVPPAQASTFWPQDPEALLLAPEVGGLVKFTVTTGETALALELPPFGGPGDSNRDTIVRVITGDYRPLAELSEMEGLELSADGHALRLADRSGQVLSIDSESGETSTLNPPRGAGEILFTSFAPDGRRIATAFEDGISVWQPGVETPIRIKAASPSFAVFGPESRTLLLQDDEGVSLVSLNDGKRLETLGTELNKVTDATFSPDGSALLLASSLTSEIELWTRPSRPENGNDPSPAGGAGGPLKRTASRSLDDFESIAFAGTATEVRLLVGREDGPLELLAQSLETVSTIPVEGELVDWITPSPTGLVVLRSGEAEVSIIDGSSGTVRRRLGFNHLVRGVALIPDGKTLVVVSRDGFHRYCLRDLLEPAPSLFHLVSPSPDGRRIAAADEWGRVHEWNAATGQLTGRRYKLPTTEVLSVLAWGPASDCLLVGGTDGHLAELPGDGDWTPLRSMVLKGGVESAAFSPDGRTVLVGGRNGTASTLDRKGEFQLKSTVTVTEQDGPPDPSEEPDPELRIEVHYQADGSQYLTATRFGVLTSWNTSDHAQASSEDSIDPDFISVQPIGAGNLLVAGILADKLGIARYSPTPGGWTCISRDEASLALELPGAEAVDFAPLSRLVCFGSGQMVSVATLDTSTLRPTITTSRPLPLENSVARRKTSASDDDKNSQESSGREVKATKLLSLCFSPTEEEIAASFSNGEVLLWREAASSNPRLAWKMKLPSGTVGRKLGFLNNGSLLAVGEKELALYDTATGRMSDDMMPLFTPLATGPQGWSYVTQLSADESLLFLRNDRSRPSSHTVIEAKRWPGTERTRCVAISPDAAWTLMGDDRGRLTLASGQTGIVESLPARPGTEVAALTFLSDPGLFVSATEDILQFWRLHPKPRPLLAENSSPDQLQQRWNLTVQEDTLEIVPAPITENAASPRLTPDTRVWEGLKASARLDQKLTAAYFHTPNPDLPDLIARIRSSTAKSADPSPLLKSLDGEITTANFSDWLGEVENLPPAHAWLAIRTRRDSLQETLEPWQRGQLDFLAAQNLLLRLEANARPADPDTAEDLTNRLPAEWQPELARALTYLGTTVTLGGTDRSRLESRLEALLKQPGAEKFRQELAKQPYVDQVEEDLRSSDKEALRRGLEGFWILHEKHLLRSIYIYINAGIHARNLGKFEDAEAIHALALEEAEDDEDRARVYVSMAYTTAAKATKADEAGTPEEARALRQEALAHAIKATETAPGDVYAWTNRADFELLRDEKGRPDVARIDEAIDRYSAVLDNIGASDPQAGLLYYEIMAWHLLFRSPDRETKAKEVAKKALARDSSAESLRAFWKNWQSVTQAGDRWALETLETGLVDTLDSWGGEDKTQNHKDLGDGLVTRNRPRDGIRAFERSLRHLNLERNDLGWFLTEIGNAYRLLGDQTRAQRFLELGIPLEQDSSWARDKQGQSLLALLESEATAAGLKILRDLHEGRVATNNFSKDYSWTYARAVAEQGKTAEALKLFEPGLEKTPGSKHLRLSLAQVYLLHASSLEDGSEERQAALTSATENLNLAAGAETLPLDHARIALLRGDLREAGNQLGLVFDKWPNPTPGTLLAKAVLTARQPDEGNPFLPERLLAEAVSREFYDAYALQMEVLYAGLRDRPKVKELIPLLLLGEGDDAYQRREEALARWTESLPAPNDAERIRLANFAKEIRKRASFHPSRSANVPEGAEWEDLTDRHDLPAQLLLQLNGTTTESPRPPGSSILFPSESRP